MESRRGNEWERECAKEWVRTRANVCVFAHMKCAIGRILRDIKMFLFSFEIFCSSFFFSRYVFEFAVIRICQRFLCWHVVLSVVYVFLLSFVSLYTGVHRSFYSPIELWIVAWFFFLQFFVSFVCQLFVVFHQPELTYSHPNCSECVCMFAVFPFLLLSNIQCPKELVSFDSFYQRFDIP